MQLRINPAATIMWYSIGESSTLVMVVDDFLSNAEDLREYATGLSYGVAVDCYYPGLTARSTLVGAAACGRWIGGHMLERLGGAPSLSAAECGNVDCTFSVLACNRTAVPPTVVDQHTDSSRRWLATVLHLSRDSDRRGTAFWQHRPTGMESWVAGDAVRILRLESLNLGLHMTAQLSRAISRTSARSSDELAKALFRGRGRRDAFTAEEDAQWHLLKFVEAKFNRLVVYPTWQIHSLVDGSNHQRLSTETMRLTMNSQVDYPLRREDGLAAARAPYANEFYVAIEGLPIG